MPRPRTSSPFSRQTHGNGRLYVPFESGEFLTLSKDPSDCYMVGGIYPKGQVIETLSLECWASGTRFKTEVRGQIIEYEVSGRTMLKVNSQSG